MQEKYDVVISGGTLIDPKSRRRTVGSVGIRNGKIAAVNRTEMEGTEVFDASGLVVCPGFVDIHSHLHKPLHGVWCALRQGITTVLSGNCGILNYMPLGKFLDELEREGYPLNFGTLVGHSWKLREMAGLTDPYRAADSSQRAEMLRLAEEALEEGAFGISLGLEYAPGADRQELLPLVKLAAKYDKLVPVHARTDALDFAPGLREIIELMEETGARLHISHLAYQYSLYPDVGAMALSMIDAARARGLPLFCDSGVYEAFATLIQSAVFDPGWYKRYNCRLSDLMVCSGKYLGRRCTEEIYEYVRTRETETVGTAFVGLVPDMIAFLKKDYVMVSTDSGLVDQPGMGHPQDAGTYPRLFGKVVREYGQLSLMDAIVKCTWLPACQMGIEESKGWLGAGADADLVVFDPASIEDKADYVGLGRPDAPPAGIRRVLVNGQVMVKDGETLEDRRPGRILRKPNRLWAL
ncbi:MAG: amidohydrolase family protein [Bacillota bacterium]|nr:amidohydrolase family protein [Bacillota bacterium]